MRGAEDRLDIQLPRKPRRCTTHVRGTHSFENTSQQIILDDESRRRTKLSLPWLSQSIMDCTGRWDLAWTTSHSALSFRNFRIFTTKASEDLGT